MTTLRRASQINSSLEITPGRWIVERSGGLPVPGVAMLCTPSMDHLQFVLLDRSGSLVKEWNRAFAKHVPDTIRSKFTMLTSTLEDLEESHKQFDCIVSPANSYGRLDGGFDKSISEALSPDDWLAPTRIAQSMLYRQWRGYAPPGACTLVPLQNSACDKNAHGCLYIALCPTMRVPENVVWNREVVYNNMWSLLVTLDQHNRSILENQAGLQSTTGTPIRKVLMTGLGTGAGMVSAQRCAQQMALALKHFEDSCANPDRWGSIDWGQAFSYAEETRRSYD